MPRQQVLRDTKVDVDIEAKASFLKRVARDPAIPEAVSARCGQRALLLHHKNSLRTQRLISRADARQLCEVCGANLSGVTAEDLKGKAMRNVKKHIRSRKNRRELLRATFRDCPNCGEKVIHKTFKLDKHSSKRLEKKGATASTDRKVTTDRLLQLSQQQR
mmetsp:Transcript_6167/g.15658  ORF Transcript_6167/g.15658 Transcript_6167/m.15658 type:complete len:161 (+) Transcript_6167:296-778(+)